jgi:hypothetical protein
MVALQLPFVRRWSQEPTWDGRLQTYWLRLECIADRRLVVEQHSPPPRAESLAADCPFCSFPRMPWFITIPRAFTRVPRHISVVGGTLAFRVFRHFDGLALPLLAPNAVHAD